MKQPKDIIRIRHMIDAAQKAVNLIQAKNRADLDKDEMLVLALTRLLEIIGEAANGVSPELRETYPAIAWKQIIGARNRLIHGYFDIDFDIIWQILTSDLPILLSELNKIVSD